MIKNKLSSLIFWMIVISFTFTQCRKEALAPIPNDTGGIPGRPLPIPSASEVNMFVWEGMHDIYLWNTLVPNLSNTYYQPLTSTSPNYKRNLDSLNTYLNKFKDPSLLFDNLTYQYGTVDKWSFIESDYTVIENWIAGISKTLGYDYTPYYYNSTSTNVFAVVNYILPGSPAEKAGIKRGDIIIKINGTQITDANYGTLLNNQATATLTLAQLTNGTLVQTTTSPLITAVQLQEDPVFLTKVFTVNGTKVGYLVYNGFQSDFDLELNTAFQQFKTAGITKLILDLRYNGGGSVQTAIYLASMIYSTNTSKVFTKSVWNSSYSSYNSNDNFTDKIVRSATSSTPINSLNLSDIYFLVSRGSASASELLINGLKPYMNVKTIGTNTYGKYVASVTIYDYALDSKGQLISDGKGDYVKVSTHKYAMQPIVAKYANSLGVSDFVSGLTPDIYYKEDAGNMLPLGDENEALLKLALTDIKGLKSLNIGLQTSLANSKLVIDSKNQRPYAFDMYIDPQKVLRRTK